MKQIIKKLLLVCTLLLHNTAHPLKLDRVILSSNDNPEYLEFWPVVAKAWKEIVGITPTLALVADDSVTVDETLGDVVRIKPMEGVSTSMHAQLIRLLLPAQYPNDVCILSDIDMLPMQKDYFHDVIKDIPDDNFVVYREYDYGNDRSYPPICYCAARGRTFANIFKITEVEEFPTIIQEWHNRDIGWHTDETVLRTALDSWYKKDTNLVRLGHTGNKRLDRSFWFYKKDLVKQHYYHDMHMVRPYSKHKKEINSIAALLGIPGYTLEEKKKNDLEHKHFEIIIPSYNNEPWCIQNLMSAVTQKHPNFHVIYIDDASTDGTGELVEKHIKKNNLEHKVKLIKNKKRAGCPLANFYKAIHQCDDRSIIVQLDGDDFLAHEDVLTKLNEVYSDKNVWMTYGSYKSFPINTPADFAQQIPDEVIKNNKFRRSRWSAAHLRTNYAWLFKQVKYEDFLMNARTFFQMAGDMFIMFPLLELAGFHSRYIDDVLYLYNLSNPLNEHRQDDTRMVQHGFIARNKQSYKPLQHVAHGADLIVFSFDRPLQLFACLESARKYLTGVNRTRVIYRASSKHYEKAYLEVCNSFEHVTFVKQENAPDDFKTLTEQAIDTNQSDYVLLSADDNILTDYVNAAECAHMIENSNAYAFYLRMGKNITHLTFGQRKLELPPHYPIKPNLIGWILPETPNKTMHPWAYQHSLDMTLYAKKDIKKHCASIAYASPKDLEAKLFDIPSNGSVGLCFELSKSVNLPFNRMGLSNEMLLELFDKNTQIHLGPLHQYENDSPYILYKPDLIKRT